MVNNSEILVLKECGGKLQVSNMPIEDCTYILSEIDNAVKNPNKTLMDVQTVFLKEVQPIRNYYPYPFPYSYSSSYIDGASKPKKYTYAEYTEKLNKGLEGKTEGKDAESVERLKQEVNTRMKSSYAEDCKRFIHQQMMYKAFQKAENDPSVKIYSRETIGWSHFDYQITDDIKACVSTNFSFGSASFFTLTISYKGIVIAPFTHLTRYYKADMTDIIKCTRDYVEERDSWNAAIDFVKDFADQSLANPSTFVEKYLMNEINEMMSGLKNIVNNPDATIRMFKNQSSSLLEYRRLRFISPMSSTEKKKYEVFTHEMPVVFKAEKLAQAVHLLERLKELGEVYQKINDCISEICRMAKQVTPQIQKTMDSIKVDITRLTKQKEPKEKEKEQLSAKIKVFEDKLNKILEKLPENSSWLDRQNARETFRKEHPEYVTLMKLKNDVECIIDDLNEKIRSRNELVTRLADCIKDFSGCASYENNA